MNIAVIGVGYVGLATGTCLAGYENKVYCVDVDEKKIGNLKNGIIPIYEPGLEEMVKENCGAGKLKFTTDIGEAVAESEVCFIAVGTPMGEDGSADLQYVINVAKGIGKNMQHHTYIVDKSTVPVGTAGKVREAVQKELDKRGSTLTFDVISNPEFLKEGTAVNDCLKPERIVIGTDNEKAAGIMKELYMPLVMNRETIIFMDIASAEMTKYSANAMLATKISFMNEIANICEVVGADVNKVRIGIGSDRRIGFDFIYAGCGYGGSCFQKDIQELIQSGRKNGYEARILNAVETVNAEQKHIIPKKILQRFGDDLNGKRFALWGLAFKPDTDDMRQAASITIVKELTDKGAVVCAYDPKAEKQARECYLKDMDNVEYADSKYTALVDADAMILVTEWKEFKVPDFDEIRKRLKAPIIFDGRNQYDAGKLKEKGFEYYQIGVGGI